MRKNRLTLPKTNLKIKIGDKNHEKDEHSYYFRGLAEYRLNNDRDRAIRDFEIAKEIATKHQYKSFIDKINFPTI